MLSLAVKRRIRGVIRLRDDARALQRAKLDERNRLSREPLWEAKKKLARSELELAGQSGSFVVARNLRPYQDAVRERTDGVKEIQGAIEALELDLKAMESDLREATAFCEELLKHCGVDDDLQGVVTFATPFGARGL